MDIYVVLPLYYRVLDSYSTVRIDSAPDTAPYARVELCTYVILRCIVLNHNEMFADGILVSKTRNNAQC